VLKVADEITVIRRGTTVATVDPREVTARQLAELMVGSELPSPETRESTVTDRVVLRVEGVTLHATSGRTLLDDVSLVIRAGEVLGIAGVEGNGQAELVETIMGMREPATGRVVLGDEDVTRWTTRAARGGHRLRPGGPPPARAAARGAAVGEPRPRPPDAGAQRQGAVDRPGRARADTERIVRDYDVRTPGIDVLASALSGGNQQKLIVGREMSGTPRLLIAAHPTRGVDVGAQAAIWDHIRTARREGLAVLLISADLDELIGLSDTITVMFRGRLVSDVDPSNVTPEDLGAAMTGAGEGAAARAVEPGPAAGGAGRADASPGGARTRSGASDGASSAHGDGAGGDA
jgi:simple sugar transport system ATP-binding protein